MLLFDRYWRVRVGVGGDKAVDFDNLDVSFEVVKSLRPEPNTCTISIWGLNREHRAAIEAQNLYEKKRIKGASSTALKTATATHKAAKTAKPGNIRVEIEAGYQGNYGLIFLGDLRRGITEQEGGEVSIRIEGEDGGRAVTEGRINESFPPGTRVLDVVKACANALGLGVGNLVEVVPYLKGSYASGTALTGPADKLLTGLLRRHKLSWSIQNGVLAFRRNGAGLQTSGFRLAYDSGLLGIPQRGTYGGVLANTLLIPSLAPGQYIQLDCKDYKDNYFIESIVTKGDSAGGDWGHTLELMPG